MTLVAHTPSQELINLVGALGGTWHGRIAMCRCPAHNDHDPSLSLRQGDRGILVTCFAGCDRTDVLRELRRVRIGHQYSYSDTPAVLSTNGIHLWDAAGPVTGTLGGRYLAGRNLSTTVHDVRFHPRCPYRPKPHTLYLPALLVAVRDRLAFTAVQRIFLDPETANYRMKLLLGKPGKGAWRGGGQVRRILALAEGFETAAAFTILKDIPCWASLGSRRFDLLDLPVDLNRLILAHDDDAAGRRAAAKAEECYGRPGLIIEHMPPPSGCKDWANLLAAGILQIGADEAGKGRNAHSSPETECSV